MSERPAVEVLPSYEEVEGNRASNPAVHPTAAIATNVNENESQRPPEKSQATAAVASHERLPQVSSADNYYGFNIDIDGAEDASSEEDPDAPPAYSNVDGRIVEDDKSPSGIGTNARATDDGRVDIRIDQRYNRLAKVLVPALRAQLEEQRDQQPPPAYIPPSLDSQPGQIHPSLNVVIHVVGSRGDVQPFVALGKVLKERYSHRVRLATHPTFQKFVEENGLEFFSIGGDPAELMAFMVKNPGLMLGLDTLRSGEVAKRRKQIAGIIKGCWRSCIEAGDGSGTQASNLAIKNSLGRQAPPNLGRPFVADAIIANPPSFAHVHCAEKLGIPLHMMFTMPWSPTQLFPHPLANIQSSNADTSITNYMSYALVDMLTWQGLGDIINRFRVHSLNLEPIHLMWAPGMLTRMRIPYTYCWSAALIPKPADWGRHISISGFYFLSLASNYNPDTDLLAFLQAGPPPVYIGFGSIVVDDPDAMTTLIFKAVKKARVRALVLESGLKASKLGIPDGIFMLGNTPHDWLFQRVSCVVHHGGAGTTAAGIKAGRPTVVVPFFGDQPFWGAMVARAGAGPTPIPHKRLTADNLAEAITEALKPSSLERAKELAEKISKEDGNNIGAQYFHQMLDLDKLQCLLLPDRAAAWRIKRTQIRLSPLAAYILAEKKILSSADLKLYRPKEYEIEDTPTNPILGGGSAALSSFTSIMMGAADLPIGVLKALFGVSDNDNGDGGGLGIDIAMGTGKGLSRVIGAAVKSPMDITLALSKGFHNIPRMYGDEVRSVDRVTGLGSGIATAGKEFGYGLFDGITGVFTKPYEGARKEGAAGFAKGVGKGLAGVSVKPAAGALGIPAYTMKGVYSAVMNGFREDTEGHIAAARIAQGFEQFGKTDREFRIGVVHAYLRLLKETKKRRGILGEKGLDTVAGGLEAVDKSIERRKGSRRMNWRKLDVTRSKRKWKKEFALGDRQANGEADAVMSELQHQDSVSSDATSLQHLGSISAAELSGEREVHEMPANEEPPARPALPLRDGSNGSYPHHEDYDDELYAYPTTELAETETADVATAEGREQEESIRESISHSPRGDDEEDHHFDRAIRANIAELQWTASIDIEEAEAEDEELRRVLTESARLHRETVEEGASEDQEEIVVDAMGNGDGATDYSSQIDEEEQLRKAMEESLKMDEEREKERREEEIVMEHVKKTSLAEAEFRRRMTGIADGASSSK